jgi:hypothetical protein
VSRRKPEIRDSRAPKECQTREKSKTASISPQVPAEPREVYSTDSRVGDQVWVELPGSP